MKRNKKYIKYLVLFYEIITFVVSIWNLVDNNKQIIIKTFNDMINSTVGVMIIIGIILFIAMLIWHFIDKRIAKRKEADRPFSKTEKFIYSLNPIPYKGLEADIKYLKIKQYMTDKILSQKEQQNIFLSKEDAEWMNEYSRVNES